MTNETYYNNRTHGFRAAHGPANCCYTRMTKKKKKITNTQCCDNKLYKYNVVRSVQMYQSKVL